MNSESTECSLDGCADEQHARGYCDKHYRRLLKTGSPIPAPRPSQVGGVCRVEGCGRKHYARTLCRAHYRRLRDGKDMDAPIRGTMAIGEWGDWYKIKKGYILRRRRNPNTGGDEYQSQHRYEMELKLGRELLAGETVHHIDLNRSNNEHSNLQLRQGQHGSGAKFICGDCASHNVIAVELD